MAGANKKSKKAVKPESAAEPEYDTDDSESYHGPQEIQATFEGRNLEAQDFHGIKQLLQQLFLTAHIELGEMSDLLISQLGIGSALKQSCNDSDDEEDMDMVDESDVFGITSVLNLTRNKERTCVQQLCNLIDVESKQNADPQTQTAFKEVLLNSLNKVGLIINERFVNIPSRISTFMLTSLKEEIDRIQKRNEWYKFDWYLIICKIGKPKGEKDGEVLFSNDEEEIFFKNADYKFDYSVASKSDTGLTGSWQSEDKELIPYRTAILFKSHKYESILNEIKHFVST